MSSWVIAVGLFAGYVVLGPDPATLTLSRGLGGAVRTGVARARARAKELRPVSVQAATTSTRGRAPRARGARSSTGAPQDTRTARSVRGQGRVPVRGSRARTAGQGLKGAPVVAVRYGRAPVWAVLGAGLRGAGEGARVSVARARASRRAGTDTASRVRRALVWAWAVGARTPGALRAARAGFAPVQGRWWVRLRAAGRAVGAYRARAQDPQATSGTAHDEPEQQEPDQGTSARQEPGLQQAGRNSSGADALGVITGDQERVMAGMGADLENVSDLRGEATGVQALLDEAGDLIAQAVSWAVNLPERIDEAPFETAALLAQAEAIAEALGAMRGLDDAGDVLSGMDAALVQAEALGEHADEVAARGNLAAFRAA